MILTILLLIAQFIFIVSILFKFYEIYKINREFKRSQKSRDNFDTYIDLRKKYADELPDISLKREFMIETAKFLEKVISDPSIYQNFNFEKHMSDMTLKWKEHIPDLKQKFRQDQLNKLV